MLDKSTNREARACVERQTIGPRVLDRAWIANVLLMASEKVVKPAYRDQRKLVRYPPICIGSRK